MYLVVDLVYMIKLLPKINEQQQMVFMLPKRGKPKITMKKERQIQVSQGQARTRLQLEDEYKPKVKMKKYFYFVFPRGLGKVSKSRVWCSGTQEHKFIFHGNCQNVSMLWFLVIQFTLKLFL